MSEENASKFFENYFDSDLQEYIYDILYYHQKNSQKYNDLIHEQEIYKSSSEAVRQVLERFIPQKLSEEECKNVIKFIENNNLMMIEECKASYRQGVIDGMNRKRCCLMNKKRGGHYARSLFHLTLNPF